MSNTNNITCGCISSRCKHKPMVHLHLHSDFSLLDGAGGADGYIKLAKDCGHKAIAITDHGNMSGTLVFYQKCKAAGIKPIIGMEAYLNDELGKHEEQKFEGHDTHQSIIIKNQEGFINLNKLTYKAFTEGYYRRGRITTDWLIENKSGLIITTSCMASKIARLVGEGKEAEAEERLKLLMREFGDDLFAELQFNEVPEQITYNRFILRMVKKYSLMPILTNDVHYALPEDNRLQDVLISINQRTTINDPNAFKLSARQLNYSNAEDFHRMNKEFGFNYPESFVDLCLENTLKVSEKCTFEFETDVNKYPKYTPTPDVVDVFKTENTTQIITKLAHGKLKQKIKKYQENGVVKMDDEKIKQYKDRLDYELKVIGDKGMLDYFLVVWELIRFCKKENISVGPGRGSAAGSLLSYCLEIVSIDPMRFDLYFERFLNPERKGTPDIDIDFEAGTDDRTMGFLLEKYGKERVVPVITFSTFNQKGCLKDVVKVLGGDTGFSSDVFAVTKEMPHKPVWDIGLEEWFETWPANPECSERVREWLTDPENEEAKKLTLKLQGQVRNWGKHAAGVVITPGPVWESIPVNITKGTVVSGFQESGTGKDLSSLGVLKLDRLKLETLNVIKHAIKLVKEYKGIDIQDKIDYVDLLDPNLYEEIRSGNNNGIFQFESEGMNNLVKGMRADKFEDLVAANSLYRPGPMALGAHTEYIKNKFEPEEAVYVHPLLTPILEKTNGVLIYQEQLMFIAKEIGGLSLGEGDNLRKYMDSAGKIIAKEQTGETLSESEKKDKGYKGYKELWNKFIDGAKEKGMSEFDVEKIGEWLMKYLGYSFNLSHATCYTYIAMQTLFLKHYYPTEFYTALLNHQKSTSNKDDEKAWLSSAILAAMTKGIKILPPSRKSNWEWTMIEDGKIAMGLSSINGFGEAAYKELSTKEFGKMSKVDFFSTKLKKFNKTTFESSLKAGVFDDWSNSREEIMAWRKAKIKNTMQIDIFGNYGVETATVLRKFATTTAEQKYGEFLGVCNLDLQLLEKIAEFKRQFYEEYQTHIEPFTNFDDDKRFYYFRLHGVEERTSKKGTKFFSILISDGAVTRRLTMWRDVYAKLKSVMIPGSFYITKFVKQNGWLSFNASAPFRRVF